MEEMNDWIWTDEEWNELMNKVIEDLNIACDDIDDAGGMRKGVLTDNQIMSFVRNISVGDLDLLFQLLGEPQIKRLSEVIVNGMMGD